MNRRVLTVGLCATLCMIGWILCQPFHDPLTTLPDSGSAPSRRPSPPTGAGSEPAPAQLPVGTTAEVDPEAVPALADMSLTFTGRVVNSDGAGLAGSWVGIMPLIPNYYRDGSEPPPPPFDDGLTDEHGRFEIVAANRASYPCGKTLLMCALKEGFGVVYHTARDLPPKEVRHDFGDVALPIAHVLRGIVVDPTGSPLAGAEVWRAGAGPPPGSGWPATYFSDTNGRFELPFVPIEKVEVGARLPGHTLATADRPTIDMPVNGIAELLTITLLPTRPVEVTVRLGPSGRGPRNTHVLVMWDTPSGERVASTFAIDPELPDPVVIEDVPIDAPGLRAVAFNGWYGQTAIAAAATGSRHIALEFDPAGLAPCLDVFVLDDATGRPVRPDLIMVQSWTSWTFGETSGPFRIEDARWGKRFERSYPHFGQNLSTHEVAPGQYRLPYADVYSETSVTKYGPPPYAITVEADGYATAHSPVRFLTGKDQVVEPWVLRLKHAD